MKQIEISEATGSMADYAREAARDDAIVLTRKGRPVAAAVSLKGIDRETLSLSQNPEFIRILEQSRRRYKSEGGISAAEMRKRLEARSRKSRMVR